ncbi:MAG: methyltransferase type 11 [Pelagibacteraceae bacterium]|nr:methyltransferase type 11 [Pelagibacteraceae bacterium]
MEIDLLKNYPKSKRNLDERSMGTTSEVRAIARKFGKEFFDGDRKHGYGGFAYNSKFWENVIPDFVNFYNLKNGSKILDVGCAKGFMLFDFKQYNNNFILKGLDISRYAIENSKEEVRENLIVGDAKSLPFEDNTFDLVISINTIHNLELKDCGISLKEIERVTKKNSFITVDAYRNNEEKERMMKWNLTAKTIMSVEDWIDFFKSNNFNGDYYWFIP